MSSGRSRAPASQSRTGARSAASRTVTPSVPVRVDYELTPLGTNLSCLLTAVKDWAEHHIEEVVEACNRLKGGKLAKEKIKQQLQKIANSRTGGMKTDEALGKSGGGPEGLPHSIIVTSTGKSARPFAVRRYSWRGGRSA